MKKVIIFSHGFGVKFDYQNLLPDIAKAFPNAITVPIEYNDFDSKINLLTVSPLDKQASKLTKIYEDSRQKYPSAEIDIICHSQGCMVAALAKLNGVNKVIFIAPPTDSDEDSIQALFKRPGAYYNPADVSVLPRRDGSITHIPAEYWVSRKLIKSIDKLYLEFIKKHPNVTIIKASEDDVIGNTDLDAFPVAVHELEADHNFTGPARRRLIAKLKRLLA